MPEGDHCASHEAMANDVAEIKSIVHRIDKRLGKGDVNFATLGVRVALHQKILFSGIALVLVAVAGAILKNVFKG